MGKSDHDPYRPNSDVQLSNARARVLVVDDDAAARVTTSELLAQEFLVFTAADGAEARSVLARESIDVICTDFQMPGQNGLDLLATAMEQDPSIAGVLVTGHREYLARRRVEGDLDYHVLLKPFDPDQLLILVRRAIKTSQLKRNLDGARRDPKAKPRR